MTKIDTSIKKVDELIAYASKTFNPEVITAYSTLAIALMMRAEFKDPARDLVQNRGVRDD